MRAIMFAVVDFDRQQSFFFNNFQAASDFITQYPVQETVVVVDLSEGHAVCEQLEKIKKRLTTCVCYAIVYTQT